MTFILSDSIRNFLKNIDTMELKCFDKQNISRYNFLLVKMLYINDILYFSHFKPFYHHVIF